MEIILEENTKNKMIFELKGGGHTICNALKDELYKDKNVKIASYNILHPVTSSPKMIIETTGTTTPKKALQEASKRLIEQSKTLREQFTKLKW